MNWTWDYPWDVGVTWAIIVAAGVIFLASYLFIRDQVFTPTLANMSMLLLRLGSFAIIVFLMLQPRVFLTRTDEVPPVVALVIDTSQSMSVVDHGHRGTRLLRATGALKRSGLLRKLKKESRLHIYQCTSGVMEVPEGKPLDALRARGKNTALGLAISQVYGEFKGEGLGALIMVTDGRNNTGMAPAVAAKEMNVPIYAIGVGKKKKSADKAKEKDLAITGVEHDRRVMVGHATDITVKVSQKGFQPRSVRVELRLDERLVKHTSVVLSPRRPEREVTLKLTPTEPGQYVYTVRVPPDPEEKNKGNNEKGIPLFVTDPVARLLYVEARPRWEYKYLSRALNAYKNIRHTVLLRLSANRPVIQGSDPSEFALIASMTPAQIQRLKVLIIGDVKRSFFTDEQLDAIASFVEQGGSLCLLGGKESLGPEGFSQTKIAKLLPVTLTGKASYVEEEFPVEMTPEGANHPAFLGTSYDWTDAPKLESRIRVGNPRAGATVLIRAADGSDDPVVLVHQYGQGKVAIVLTDSTWRWQMGLAISGAAVNYHAFFWRQLIQWLLPETRGKKETRSVQLIANKLKYELNEEVKLSISALNREGSPAANAKVTCKVFAPDGKEITLHAKFGKLGKGTALQAEGFSASFTPHVSGKYKVVAKAMSAGATLGRDELSFLVGDTSVEMNETDPDHDLLKELAEITNGKYYNEKEVKQLVKDLRLKTKKSRRTEKRDIWNEWKFFILLVALLGTEWAIRKWRQLE